jgi:UDP-2,3-diacylglucosamine pyrophosphatase LpxH
MTSEPFRAVWLSDVHLGSRACRAGLLLDFLEKHPCEVLYLVGDIIDLQSLRQAFFWPPSHTEVLALLLKRSQEGTRVVFLPGNHDADLRSLSGTKLGNIEIARRCIHTTRNGRRLLVLHGDEFDGLIRHSRLAMLLGAAGYTVLLTANRFTHWIRELSGRPYWSLAQHVKTRLGKAMRYVRDFERASIRAAKQASVHGVVCGHIHKADLHEQDGLLYCNDGDWVESCTAVVEDRNGELSLVTWRPQPAIAPIEMPSRHAA